MRVLLHICCGPCAIMPIRRLLDEGHEVCGFFYNPNIQPLSEYLRRRDGAERTAEKYNLKMLWALEDGDYDSIGWMRMQRGREAGERPGRCGLCWGQRLRRTYDLALESGFDAFTSSLLYSRRQQHDAIAGLASEIAYLGPKKQTAAGRSGPVFLYKDFRKDWQEGITVSKQWGIYRQQYCGCLFSENERYAGELEKSNLRLAANGAWPDSPDEELGG